jgi:hypothetical protein
MRDMFADLVLRSWSCVFGTHRTCVDRKNAGDQYESPPTGKVRESISSDISLPQGRF